MTELTERQPAQLRSAYVRLVPPNVQEVLSMLNGWSPDSDAARSAACALMDAAFPEGWNLKNESHARAHAAIELWLEAAHTDPDEVRALAASYAEEADFLAAEMKRREEAHDHH